MRSINLLPPEAHQRALARRRRTMGIIAFAAYLVILGLLSFYWSSKVAAAQQDLEVQQARNAELQAEISRLESARKLKDSYDRQVQMLEVILASDVAWGRLLNDLGRVIPDRVWLEGFSGSVTADEETADEETAARLGNVTATGVAFEYPDVAAWLRVVDSDQFPALSGAWVNTATLAQISESDVVRFDSLAALTTSAVSERLAERIPRVPR
ncbi:MAG: PilN domain-containing protein [Actinomycetota bacterium]|nr:PilN domain-containing protein [Actinomycetota bacterium]